MSFGPRGYGCARASCFRVVLDSNCFRGATTAELSAVCRRGFLLSISIEALREVWAQSIREQRFSLLATRVRQLGPLVDPMAPVAFTGNALLTSLGLGTTEQNRTNASFRSRITDAWTTLVAQGVGQADWRAIGEELAAELNEDENNWKSQVDEFISINRARTPANAKVVNSQRFVRRASEIVFRKLANTGVDVKPGVGQRVNASLKFVIGKVMNAHHEMPARNDWVDGRLLQHIAWPSFLMTNDFRLIEAVDRSRSMQAQWIRTPRELAETRVAHCEPWGRPARAVASRFRRDPPHLLRADQERWRAAVASASG